MIRLQVLGTLALADAGGQDIRPVLTQPKRFALLAYLTLAEPRGFRRRDALLPLFWPESAGEPARASLRRALHFLRSHVGEDVIVSRGEEEVAIARERLVCDALTFEEHLAAGRDAEGLALYHGDLLTGFFVSEAAPELDEWIDHTRRRFREAAFAAAERLGERDAGAGRVSTARFWAQRALELQPLSEPAQLRMLRLLERAGERAEALRLAEDFARRLQTELGVEPGPELRTVIHDLHARRPTPPPPAVMPPAPGTSPAVAVRPNRRPWRWPVAVGAAAVIATAAWIIARRPPGPGAVPVLAVGAVVAGGVDSLNVAASLPELLATGLGNLPDVQVISRARLYEVSGEMGERALTAPALLRAAKQAGAAQLVEGEVYPQPDGWRLDLRLVNLANGAVRRAWVVRAAEPFALADTATARLAAELRRPAPATGAATYSTGSLVARRYFDDGLRAYARHDLSTADALFGLALGEDPAFPLALYYASRTRSDMGAPREEGMALTRRALEAARDHGTRYERLLLSAWWAQVNQSPSGLALADSLLAAFPYDPEAYVIAGSEFYTAADYAGSARVYRRLAALDSQSLQTGGPWCRACLALEGLAGAYAATDSIDQALAAERRVWQAQPRNKTPWSAMIYFLSITGRTGEAQTLLDTRADSVDADLSDIAQVRAWLALRRGDFAAADRAIGALMALSGESRHTGLWIQIITDRIRGRLTHARTAAAEYVHAGSMLPLGIVLSESGRARQAAALWDSLRLTWDVHDTAAGATARQHAWMLTHEVTALAAAGDTGRLKVLIDTLEIVGRWSSYARDRRMHHYARGLLWDARGRPGDAVLEYRQALTSWLYGFTRINYRLAADLVALGRPAEAIPLVHAALHGGFESTNLYLTHTELHEILARAFDMAGQRDSAAAQYRWVAAAWTGADSPFLERGRTAAMRAAQLHP